MARIRTIKPDFWTDEKLVECSTNARLFFIGLLNFSDDYGNLQRSAKKLKLQIFPADSFDCEPLIQELMQQGLLVEYRNQENTYLHIKGFDKHQKVDRPSRSNIPPYWLDENAPKNEPNSTSDSRALDEPSTSPRDVREGKGREGNKNNTKQQKLSLPREDAAAPAAESSEVEKKIKPDPEPDAKPDKPASTPPPADAITTSARSIIEAFENTHEAATGNRRPWPHPKDLTTAKGWLLAGAKPEDCIEVIQRICHRASDQGSKLPTSLPYFDKAIRETLAETPNPDWKAKTEKPIDMPQEILRLLQKSPLSPDEIRTWFAPCAFDIPAKRIIPKSSFMAQQIDARFKSIISGYLPGFTLGTVTA